MTNDKTVTMSRELAEQWLVDLEGCTAFVVAVQLRALLAKSDLVDHCKQCADTVQRWPESKRDCLGKIAAPVVERQEPVVELKGLRFHANKAFEKVNKAATAYESGESALGLMEDIAESLLIIRNGLDTYTWPPAPAAVVLPEKRKVRKLWYPSFEDYMEQARDVEWNACLDKVKEMNR